MTMASPLLWPVLVPSALRATELVKLSVMFQEEMAAAYFSICGDSWKTLRST